MRGTASALCAGALALGSLGLAACQGSIGDPSGADDTVGDDDPGDPPGDPGDPPDDPGDPPGDPATLTVRVGLAPQTGVAGVQRVNFALPLPPGAAGDPPAIRVLTAGGDELRAGRRVLARWGDGSPRSVQLQVDVDVGAVDALDVRVGEAPTTGDLALAPVASTLVVADGTSGPRVWAILPPEWLADSGVAGPIVPRSRIAGTPLDAWGTVCNYGRFDVRAFLAAQADKGPWLFDRVTSMYRGHAITGSMVTLESAYREAAIYRSRITGTGTSTRIGVPDSAGDLKYHYTQGMAIHYLLTGDDRFREAAENVAIRARALWTSPTYDGPNDFWTERHAGFGLLAYEWALAVTDDQAATFAPWADQAVDAYLAMQGNGAAAWEADARCFAHHASAHGEGYGYVGCSPWMSAILGDALDTYARRVGGARAATVRDGLAKLGRMIARHGRASNGRPYYWMGAGVARNEADGYDEHWGESAYLVAMAWHWSGRTDDTLRAAAMSLLDGLRTRGQAGQIRSFNWQCRSAVMAPYYLLD